MAKLTEASVRSRMGGDTRIEVPDGPVSGSCAGIVGVYQRHRFEKEKRQALEAWAGHMQALLAPRKAAENLVLLHG